MSFLRTRRFNLEAVLKVLLLSGFAFFFYQTLNSGRALLFVNPKMIPFIKFAIIAMGFMIIATLPEIFTIPRRKLRLIPYTLFFIPLLLAGFFPAVALDSGSLAGRNVDMGGPGVMEKREAIPHTERDDESMVMEDRDVMEKGEFIPDIPDTANEEQALLPAGEKVEIDAHNYVVWLTALYQRPEEHSGLEVEITGFVYINEELKAGTFLLSRLIMVCCAADMQLSGILCHYDGAEELAVDTWLRVNGTLSVGDFNNRPIPTLMVEQITEIEQPEIPYVFP